MRGRGARDAALRAGGGLLPRRGVHLLRQQVHAQAGAVRRAAGALRQGHTDLRASKSSVIPNLREKNQRPEASRGAGAHSVTVKPTEIFT